MSKIRKGVHLLDTKGKHCRFPMWEDKCTLIVCGEPGYPWCEKHRALVFQRKAERAKALVNSDIIAGVA